MDKNWGDSNLIKKNKKKTTLNINFQRLFLFLARCGAGVGYMDSYRGGEGGGGGAEDDIGIEYQLFWGF